MNRNDALIEADELLGKINDPNVRIFDTSIFFFRKDNELTAFETYQQGHIPGSAFFDHQAFSDSNNRYMYMVLAEAELADQVARIGIDNDSEVILYASNIIACATRAWWVLRYAGVNNVRVLNGGLTAWKEAGGALESGTNRYEASSFTPHLRPEMFASKDEVEAALKDGATCTVNTLPTEVYNKSHITGSSNLPLTNLMDDMMWFLADDEMKAELVEEAKHERIITYCGGGIAATANAMAHLIVGNSNVAVYDGSMDEWQGEGLPVTKAEGV